MTLVPTYPEPVELENELTALLPMQPRPERGPLSTYEKSDVRVHCLWPGYHRLIECTCGLKRRSLLWCCLDSWARRPVSLVSRKREEKVIFEYMIMDVTGEVEGYSENFKVDTGARPSVMPLEYALKLRSAGLALPIEFVKKGYKGFGDSLVWPIAAVAVALRCPRSRVLQPADFLVFRNEDYPDPIPLLSAKFNDTHHLLCRSIVCKTRIRRAVVLKLEDWWRMTWTNPRLY